LLACLAISIGAWRETAQWSRANCSRLQAVLEQARFSTNAADAARQLCLTASSQSAGLKAQIDRLRASLKITLPSERLKVENAERSNWESLSRAIAQRNYGAFFRLRNLSLEKRQALIAIQVRQSDEYSDITAALRSENLTQSDPIAREALSQVGAQSAQAERDLLGQADFAALNDYDRSQQARYLVSQWAGGSAVELGEPITAQQGGALLQTIEQASASYQQGGYIDPTEVDWNAVAQAAQGYLSPAQLRFVLTAEPPLPSGGRFQSALYNVAQAAQAAETASTH
jgi:hypothetical protein